MAELICDKIDRLEKELARAKQQLKQNELERKANFEKLIELKNELQKLSELSSSVRAENTQQLEVYLKDLMRYLCPRCIDTLKKVVLFRVAGRTQH